MTESLPLLSTDEPHLEEIYAEVLSEIDGATLALLTESNTLDSVVGYCTEAYLANQRPSILTAVAAVGAWSALAFAAKAKDILLLNQADIAALASLFQSTADVSVVAFVLNIGALAA